MAARFSALNARRGYDGSGARPWQMVPVGGSRTVLLLGARGTPVSTSNARIATVTDVAGRRRTLQITGVARGTCEVRVGSSAPYEAVLEIAVKARKTINTAFHYVDDGRRQKTRRNIRNIDRIVTAINRIMERQANLVVVKKSAAALAIAQNLGRVVRFSSHEPTVPAAQHEWGVVTAGGDAAADWNVFFVRRYEQDTTPFRDDAEAGTMGMDTICEDHTGERVSTTLAHELGHGLTLDHPGHTRRDLMFGSSGSGTNLTKADINTINP